MDLGLKDSAAVVTGGSKGMGRAIAEAFADDGARVAILARGTEAIDETLEELRRRGCPDAIGLSVDIDRPRRDRRRVRDHRRAVGRGEQPDQHPRPE